MKKLDAIISETLVSVLDKLNDLQIQRCDIVNILQNKEGLYVAIFYV